MILYRTDREDAAGTGARHLACRLRTIGATGNQ